MGALRRISSDLRRLRGPRVLAVGGIVVAAVTGAVACQPVDGDVNPATVASTTDQEATRELNRTHARVTWISCAASYNGRSTPTSTKPQEVTVACRGKAKEGRDVRIKGWVYGVVPGKCVRGNLIARIDNKVWFHLQVLGNCAAPDPTRTFTPAPKEPAGQQPEPGTTRTVTKTVTVAPPDPSCSCFQGK